LKLRWTNLALKDFEQAHDYIMQEDPESAQRIAQRILDATRRLQKYPRMGRVGADEETRELVVQKTPYLLVYSLTGDAIELLRVWHTSQDRLST